MKKTTCKAIVIENPDQIQLVISKQDEGYKHISAVVSKLEHQLIYAYYGDIEPGKVGIKIKADTYRMEKLFALLKDGIRFDGGHHKQYYLKQIAKLFNMSIKGNYEKGIPA